MLGCVDSALGNLLAQALQVTCRLSRSLFRRPWREFLRRLGIEWAGLQFEQDGVLGEGHDRMPRAGRKFDACRDFLAKQLRAERADLLRCAPLIEDDQRELPFHRKQRFRFRVQGMPVWPDVAVDPDGVEQTLTGILIALVNIQVLSLPWRLPCLGNQVA